MFLKRSCQEHLQEVDSVLIQQDVNPQCSHSFVQSIAANWTTTNPASPELSQANQLNPCFDPRHTNIDIYAYLAD